MYLKAHIKKYVPMAFPGGKGAKEEETLLLFYYPRLIIPMESRMIGTEAWIWGSLLFFILIILSFGLLICP